MGVCGSTVIDTTGSTIEVDSEDDGGDSKCSELTGDGDVYSRLSGERSVCSSRNEGECPCLESAGDPGTTFDVCGGGVSGDSSYSGTEAGESTRFRMTSSKVTEGGDGSAIKGMA